MGPPHCIACHCIACHAKLFTLPILENYEIVWMNPSFVGFGDHHSISEVNAEVSVLAEPSTTPLSEAVFNVQDVSPDEAQPSSGEVEQTMGTPVNVPDTHGLHQCELLLEFNPES